MKRRNYENYLLERSVLSAIRKVVEQNEDCQEVLEGGKDKANKLKEFAKENDIRICYTQYYVMQADVRRTLKVNLENAVRRVVNDATMIY